MENVIENAKEDNTEEKEGGPRGGGGEGVAVGLADLSVVGNESKKWPTPNDCHLAIATSLCGLMIFGGPRGKGDGDDDDVYGLMLEFGESPMVGRE